MAAPHRQDRRSRAVDAGGAARPGAARRSRPMVGRAAADCAQAARPRRFQDRPTRSPTAPPRRSTRTIAPSSNSPPAGSRCASCASRRRRSPISPASPRASPIRSRWRALVLLARPRRRSARARHRRRAPTTKRRRAIRPPITASWRARGLGIDAVTLRNLPEPPAEHRRLEVARAFEILYAIDERDLVAVMAADLADKTTDVGALTTLAEIAAHHNDARATLLIGKTALGRGLPLRALCVSGFRRAELPADRARGRALRRLFDRAPGKRLQPRAWFPAPTRIGLMQVTPGGRPRHRQEIQRRVRPAPPDGRRRLQRRSSAPPSSATTSRAGAAPTSWPSPPTMPARAGRRSGSSNTAIRAIRRSTRSTGSSASRFSETRNYVQRVIENMQVYRARLGNNPRLLIEADLRRGG